MENQATNSKKRPSNAERPKGGGWVSVSNGIEFFLIRKSELAQAESAGFYRPEDQGKTVVSKDGRLYEVDTQLRQSAIASGFTDLVAREKKNVSSEKTRPHTSVGAEGTGTASSQTAEIASEGSEPAEPSTTPTLDDLLPESPKPSISISETNQASPNQAELPDGLSLVARAVEQVDRDAEQLRIEREAEIDSLVGWRRAARRFTYWIGDRQDVLFKRIGTNGISIALHLVIVMLLSCVFLVDEKRNDGVLIVASPTSDEILVEEVQIETEPLELTEPTQAAPAESTPVEEVSMEVTEMAPTPDFLASVKGDAIKPPVPNADPAKDPGDGTGKSLAKPTFFSSSLAARNFVFVIDNSNSMTRGRFETALLQLMLTVRQLTPKQRFYVIFYSDTAYGMMHPKPVKDLVAATTRNKIYLEQWLNTVQLCLQTNGKEAIQKAFELDPDVIYVLGDGAFTDKAATHFVKNPHPSIVMHTRGMEVKPNLAKDFKELAVKHRGTYKDVGVMPEGLLLSKQYPRPRNNRRGPVWGITLPNK